MTTLQEFYEKDFIAKIDIHNSYDYSNSKSAGHVFNQLIIHSKMISSEWIPS